MLKLTQLSVCALLAAVALGASEIEDISDCNECLEDGEIPCRSLLDDKTAICCEDEDEIESGKCIGKRDDFYCSTSYNRLSSFSCPYQATYCGTLTSQIEMHPETRPGIRLEIKNYKFVEDSVCYYQVYVDMDFLDVKKSDYDWLVTFDALKDVKAVMGKGKDLLTTSEAVQVVGKKKFKLDAIENP